MNNFSFREDVLKLLLSDAWDVCERSRDLTPDLEYEIRYIVRLSRMDLAAGADLYKVLGKSLRDSLDNTGYVRAIKEDYEYQINKLKKEVAELEDYKTYFDKEKELRK